MTKPIASLSLDLDNKWAYLRTHGVSGWDEYPSYLDVVVPRVLRCCNTHDVRLTCFIVGRDAGLERNRGALAALAAFGHEIGNHSLNHYPWMSTLPREQVEAEIVEAETLIEDATDRRPIGFRGPAYSLSNDILEILAEREYLYDASTLPTFLGPLARWYVRLTSSREANEQTQHRNLFGSLRDGFRPIKPYEWMTPSGPILEIPVTTFPIVRVPIHMTYLMYLLSYSRRLARAYFTLAMTTCHVMGVAPSLLLHPIDFLGAEDDDDLRFFPGMNLPLERKSRLIAEVLRTFQSYYDVQPMGVHAAKLRPTPMRPAAAEPAIEKPARELVAR